MEIESQLQNIANDKESKNVCFLLAKLKKVRHEQKIKTERPLGGLADLSRRELNPGLKRDKLAY
jgi:hypothetical protein